MLSQNIKTYRKAKEMSQEKLAVRLNVVRQTVSKWEHNLSVPDAQMLILLSQALEVPVSALLGVEVEERDTQQLSQELARVNQELARLQQHTELRNQANRKRGIILLLAFLTLIVSLGVHHAVVSLVLSGICILATLGKLRTFKPTCLQMVRVTFSLSPVRILVVTPCSFNA